MRTQCLHHPLGIFVGIAAGEADQVNVMIAERQSDLACNMVCAFDQIGDDKRVADAFAAILPWESGQHQEASGTT